MTTDTDALTERIARELFLCERWNWNDARPDGTRTPEGDLAEREKVAAMWDAEAGRPWYESQWPSFRQTYPRLAAAVLPIVAAEVRKAKAEALREAKGRVYASSWWADGSDNYADRVRGFLGTLATEHETGGSDERR